MRSRDFRILIVCSSTVVLKALIHTQWPLIVQLLCVPMLVFHMLFQGVPGLQNLFTKIANQARVCDVDGFDVLRNVIFEPGELSTVVATPPLLAL